MKKFLLLLMPLFAAAQQPASKVLGISVEGVELHDNLVTVTYLLDIDGARIGRTERWEVTPTLGGAELPMIVVNGRHKANMAFRAQLLGNAPVNYRGGGGEEYDVRRNERISFKSRATVPWQPTMSGAPIVLKTRVITCCSERLLEETLPAVLVEKVAVAAPREVPSVVPAPVPSPVHEAVGQHTASYTARIVFPAGLTAIDRMRGNNDQELYNIRENLRRIEQNPRMVLDGITITGYASPEGAWESNNRLAAARVGALRIYIAQHFGVDIDKIVVGHVAEDWQGLRRAVARSGMWDMDAVLQAIDSTADPDVREQRLRGLDNGMPWGQIMREIMPALRRTEYTVTYTVVE